MSMKQKKENSGINRENKDHQWVRKERPERRYFIGKRAVGKKEGQKEEEIM